MFSHNLEKNNQKLINWLIFIIFFLSFFEDKDDLFESRFKESGIFELRNFSVPMNATSANDSNFKIHWNFSLKEIIFSVLSNHKESYRIYRDHIFSFFFCFIFLLQWISKKSKTDRKFAAFSLYWFMNERKYIARNEIYYKFIDRFYLIWHNLEKSFCTVSNMPNKFLLFKWF